MLLLFSLKTNAQTAKKLISFPSEHSNQQMVTKRLEHSQTYNVQNAHQIMGYCAKQKWQLLNMGASNVKVHGKGLHLYSNNSKT